MRGVRCERILALALILAGSFAAMGQEQEMGTQPEPKVAAVPGPVYPSEQTAAQSPTTSEVPASEPAASSNDEGLPPAKVEGAAEPAAKPDATAALDPADRAVAEKIRDVLATASDKIFATAAEREATQAFYAQRQFAPLWLDKGFENARAAAVMARLSHADEDGLESSDYQVASFAAGAPDRLAEAELKLTQAVLTYARHVQAGRFPYSRVREDNIGLPQAAPEPERVLRKLAEAADAGVALGEFSPQHEPYRRLKAMLAMLRSKSSGAGDELPEGPVLSYSRKHQMEDARVPQLRERLGVAGEASDRRYDAKLSEAVKTFQRAHRLRPTGNLDARTLRELNGRTHEREIETIIANMERWRWYPRDLGEAHVEVNEPDFTLKVLHEGQQVWASRIVIGKPSMPTPLLSEKMNSITINPTWHVPPSIVHNEYLPAQAKDPGVLSRMGLRVSYKDGEVQITMPPGGENPLGHIRFNFFNRFLVYQHDTPDQYMFAHDVRAESHGCMRVKDAAKYAEVLAHIARPDEQWTAERIKAMYGSAEQEIPLQSVPIWIHLTYQTAFVDDDGKLQIRRDIYNLDSRTLAAIKNRAAVEPTAESRHEPKREPKHSPEIASTSRRHRVVHYSRGGDFYQPMLFAGPSYAAPRPQRRAFYR